MKYTKMLALIAFSVTALLTVTGSASATTFTSPSGTVYTGEIKGTAGTTELHGSFVTIRCNKSTIVGNIQKHGAGFPVSGNISSLTFTECNFPVKVLKAGSWEFYASSGGNGNVSLNGGEITIETSIANCLFTTYLTPFTFWGGSFPYISHGATLLPRTGHSVFCGGAGHLTVNYRISTPLSLYLDS